MEKFSKSCLICCRVARFVNINASPQIKSCKCWEFIHLSKNLTGASQMYRFAYAKAHALAFTLKVCTAHARRRIFSKRKAHAFMCMCIVWSFPQTSWELCSKIFANAFALSYQTQSAYEVQAGSV